MADSFGSLPNKTVEELPSSKPSRSSRGAKPKTNAKIVRSQGTLSYGKHSRKLDEDQPIRHELIARVRAEIEAGTFETPDRIEATLDCILDEIL